MLARFTVGNFLSLKDKYSLSFIAKKKDKSLPESIFTSNKQDLVKSIAIFGANASGKSNLIKALRFTKGMVVNGLKKSLADSIEVDPFLLNTTTEKSPSFFELEILSGKKTFVYGFEVSSKKVSKEWLYQFPNQKILFERLNQEIKTNVHFFREGTASARKNTRENVLFLTVVASLNGVISKELVEAIKKIRVISGLEKNKTLNYSFDKFSGDKNYRAKMKEFVVQAGTGVEDIISEERPLTPEEIAKLPTRFKSNISGQMTEVSSRNLSTVHQKYDEEGKSIGEVPFDFFDESDGTQQIFALSGPIIDSLEQGNTLVIDELDSNLHPLVCRYVLKMFNSSDKNKNAAQLVFTTHDTSLLDEDLLRKDQVWFTQKDKTGATEVFSLADLGERSNLNFAKRYLEGRYGALPYIRLLEGVV